MDYNVLTSLPPTFTALQSLVQLDASYNQLQTLPEEHRQDEATLRILSLSHNKLKTLPASIGELTELEMIFLSNNKLTFFAAGNRRPEKAEDPGSDR